MIQVGTVYLDHPSIQISFITAAQTPRGEESKQGRVEESHLVGNSEIQRSKIIVVGYPSVEIGFRTCIPEPIFLTQLPADPQRSYQ